MPIAGPLPPDCLGPVCLVSTRPPVSRRHAVLGARAARVCDRRGPRFPGLLRGRGGDHPLPLVIKGFQVPDPQDEANLGTRILDRFK